MILNSGGIFKLPNFRKVYLAGSTSELGSFVTETVLMLFVFKFTGQNKAYLGILRTVFLVSLTLGGILGGPIGNHFNRKKILIFCELARIPLILLLIFYQNIYIVIACDAGIAFFTGIFRPSRQALINEIVPQEKIKKANSLFGSTNAILHLLGPLLGATLFTFFNGISEVLFLDLMTYLLGIILISKVSYNIQSRSKNTDYRLFQGIRDGFTYIKDRPELLAINLNTFCAGLAIGVLIPLLVPFILEVLGKTENDYGILMCFFGVGGIIGSWHNEKVSSRLPYGKVPYLSIILETIAFYLFINCRIFWICNLIFLVWGYLVFIRITAQMNLISETVETHYLTRVHSLLEMSFIVPNISGGLIIALIGNEYNTFLLLKLSSFIFFLLILVRLPFKHMKELWNNKPKKITRNVQV